MKTVTVMYMKGSDFTHLFISIDGKKFSEDKTDFMADLPIPSWFKPSDDDSFEWVGFVEEIERAANTGIENLSFVFRGDKNDEVIFMEELGNNGVRHDSGTAKDSVKGESKEVQEERWERILEQAYDDLDKESYTAAFRGFQKASGKLLKAKFEMAQLYLRGKGVEEDKARAVELFLECEKEGILEANSSLAQCYYCGWEVEKNAEQAYAYAVKGYDAPEKYGYMAHYFAGCCLLYGEGVEKNPDEAIRHLKVAVDAEYGGYSALGLAYEEKGDYTSAFKVYEAGSRVNPDCFYHLARCYEEGKGVPQDDYKAFENIKKVPDTNYDGQMLLAIYYLQGTGTSQDIEKAAEIGRSFLKEYSDDPDLLALLAMCHLVKEEFEEAADYFKKAIEAGDDGWKIRLGDCYLESGKYKMAEDVLSSALNDSPEDGEIYYYLGKCYFHNDSPLKDNKKAIKYFEKGAALGDGDAMYSLAMYYYDMDKLEKYEKYLEMAVQNGHIEAKAFKGMLEYNDGNIPAAVSLLEESAEEGDSDSQYCLGRCYLADAYSGHDHNQGIYWLSRAAEGDCGEACSILSNIYRSEEFKDEQKCFEYEMKGNELGDEDSTYWLAYRYLYNERYMDEAKGIELLRGLSRKGVDKAKYMLAEFHYMRYRVSIRKISYRSMRNDYVDKAVMKMLPNDNYLMAPCVYWKKGLRQIKDEKNFTREDFANIHEMVMFYKQLIDSKELICGKKHIEDRLGSIKNKYRR